MSQTRDEANSAAQTAKSALQSAADTQFIANVDAQITAAIAQGKFQIQATSSKGMDLHYLFNYYSDLGYGVVFPDYLANLNLQPADLFGPYWEGYWLNRLSLYHVKNPARMIISWR